MSDQNIEPSRCHICGETWTAHTNRIELDCPVAGPAKSGSYKCCEHCEHGPDFIHPTRCPACHAEPESGLPQSEHGGLHPELLARITAAKAVLGEFHREQEAWLGGHSETPIYADHALRLVAELRGLLDVIERLGK